MKPHQPSSSIHLGIAVSILMLAACSGTDSSDSAYPTLGLGYDLTSVSAGDVLEVDVQMSGMHDIYGVALDLVYDPSLLEFQDSSAGQFLGIDGVDVVFAAALENGTPGRLVAGVSRVGSAPGLDGSGSIMSMRFKVLDIDAMTENVLSPQDIHALDSRLEEIDLIVDSK